jgi:hypothetical protein
MWHVHVAYAVCSLTVLVLADPGGRGRERSSSRPCFGLWVSLYCVAVAVASRSARQPPGGHPGPTKGHWVLGAPRVYAGFLVAKCQMKSLHHHLDLQAETWCPEAATQSGSCRTPRGDSTACCALGLCRRFWLLAFEFRVVSCEHAARGMCITWHMQFYSFCFC